MDHAAVYGLVVVTFASHGISGSVSDTSSTCDHLSVHFHQELGCRPIFTTDPSCPSSFDCGALEYNRRNYCVAKGLVVDKGGKIELGAGISNPCVPGCYCYQSYNQKLSRYRWQCTHSDCPQYFQTVPEPGPGCFWQEELRTCCPWRQVCKSHLVSCVHNGITYKENNRFYTFKGSTCMKCICDHSFNSTHLSDPACVEIGCDLEVIDGDSLARGCAPIYSKNFCCPIDWRCPEPGDAVIIGSENATRGGQCRFGNMLLYVGDRVYPYEEADCRCSIPPYVVCTTTD